MRRFLLLAMRAFSCLPRVCAAECQYPALVRKNSELGGAAACSVCLRVAGSVIISANSWGFAVDEQMAMAVGIHFRGLHAKKYSKHVNICTLYFSYSCDTPPILCIVCITYFSSTSFVLQTSSRCLLLRIPTCINRSYRSCALKMKLPSDGHTARKAILSLVWVSRLMFALADAFEHADSASIVSLTNKPTTWRACVQMCRCTTPRDYNTYIRSIP
jgi:hypothetical protein